MKTEGQKMQICSPLAKTAENWVGGRNGKGEQSERQERPVRRD